MGDMDSDLIGCDGLLSPVVGGFVPCMPPEPSVLTVRDLDYIGINDSYTRDMVNRIDVDLIVTRRAGVSLEDGSVPLVISSRDKDHPSSCRPLEGSS